MTDKCDKWDFDPKNRHVIKPAAPPTQIEEFITRAENALKYQPCSPRESLLMEIAIFLLRTIHQ